MKHFAQLISSLESTNKTNAKIDAIVNYLENAPDNDKLWFLALFTGKRPKRPVNTNYLKQWALEITGLPEWLFVESYTSVGDLGETLSLILPAPEHHIEKTLSEWMGELLELKDKTEEEKKQYVGLPQYYRFGTQEEKKKLLLKNMEKIYDEIKELE